MVRLVPRLELNVVTGFLGSGKTTLLKRYLQQQPVGSTLVIINEFTDERISVPGRRSAYLAILNC
jgi:G3E family GTPase